MAIGPNVLQHVAEVRGLPVEQYRNKPWMEARIVWEKLIGWICATQFHVPVHYKLVTLFGSRNIKEKMNYCTPDNFM